MGRGIEVENLDRVRIIRIRRPPANALDLRLTAELLHAVQRAVADEVGAVVLTGYGSFFSAGVDLGAIPGYSPAEQREMVSNINHVVQALYELRMPAVAALNGHAIGGGMVLGLCCDYRLAPPSGARLGLTEARAAVPFPAAAMEVVKAELSPAAARTHCLVAESGEGVQALAAGMIDETRALPTLLARARELAEHLASVPRDSYRRVKEQLRRATYDRIDDIVANGEDPMLDGWLNAETQAAAAALLKRR